jgi:hypothetical protein
LVVLGKWGEFGGSRESGCAEIEVNYPEAGQTVGLFFGSESFGIA